MRIPEIHGKVNWDNVITWVAAFFAAWSVAVMAMVWVAMEQQERNIDVQAAHKLAEHSAREIQRLRAEIERLEAKITPQQEW